MLLVDHGQPQARKPHLLLNHRVRTHHQRRRAAGNQRQHVVALLFFLAAGQPGHALAARRQQRFEPAHQLGKMLLGQNFGWRHQRALPASIDGLRGRQRGHHRLACAHITLQQAVHRQRAGQIARNLLPDAALRGGQRKRQRTQQLLLQAIRPGAQQRRAPGVAFALGAQLRELLRQQFLGLQALPGRRTAVFVCGAGRIGRRLVQLLQGLAQATAPVLQPLQALQHGWRQGLR